MDDLIKVRALANAGDANAQCDLGFYYLVIKRYDRECLKWFKLSANAGNVRAQMMLGWVYCNGTPCISKNYKRAIKWYELAAKQGDILAKTELAKIKHKII